jgi:hypothetical protein
MLFCDLLLAPKRALGKGRRVAVLLVAFLLVGVGLASLVGGAVIVVLNRTATDKEGYSLSASYHVNTSAYGFMLGLYPDSDPGTRLLRSGW